MNIAALKYFYVVAAGIAGVGVVSYVYTAYKKKEKEKKPEKGKDDVETENLMGYQDLVENEGTVEHQKQDVCKETFGSDDYTLSFDQFSEHNEKTEKRKNKEERKINDKSSLNYGINVSNPIIPLKTSDNCIKENDTAAGISNDKELQHDLLTELEKERLNLNLLIHPTNIIFSLHNNTECASLEFDDNDSLEETPITSIETEESPIETNESVVIVETTTSGEFLSEENIDCGLGDSLMEDVVDVLEPPSSINLTNMPCSDVVKKPLKDNKKKKNFIFFDKNTLDKKSQNKNDMYENKMSALFNTQFKNDKEPSKFKSKIPHINTKSFLKTPTKTDLEVKKKLKKENFPKPLHPDKTKATSVKKTTTNSRSTSNLQKLSLTNTRQPFKKNIFPGEVLYKKNKRDNKNDILLKKPPVVKSFFSANNFEEFSNVKTSSSLSKSRSASTSASNLDDSLEDLSVIKKKMADSLEDVGGILDEEPCLVDEDDECKDEDFCKDSIESSPPMERLSVSMGGELKEFEENSQKAFMDDNLFLIRPDFDQSFFIEQNENELLFNIAMEENSVDVFISFLRRPSTSKQQQMQCWKCLEKLSKDHEQSASFHIHLPFLLSFFTDLYNREGTSTSPFKILMSLSRNHDSILFILSSKVSDTILNLFRPETAEEILFLWLPLIINIMIYIKKYNLNSKLMFNFYHQYFLSLENSEQNPQHNHTTISFHHKEHFSKLLQSAASYDMKIINDTLYQVLFKAEHKKETMENIEKLTKHPNKHVIALSKPLHLSFQHMK